jgi:hypothetical protein
MPAKISHERVATPWQAVAARLLFARGSEKGNKPG